LPSPVELDRLHVVLVGPRNPLNIGAAARAMSNFGFLQLRVVNPYEVAFREARSAMGAAELLASAEEFTSVADAVADCALVVGTTSIQHRDLQHPIRRLDDAAILILQHIASAPVALLFGSEKFGLSNDELSHCHWLVNIPTRDAHVSMNLGQAVAVALYELVRNVKTMEPPKTSELAAAGDVERVTRSLLEALSLSGYATPATIAATEEKLRRMVRRLNLSGRDAELWLGMLRQILWKIRAS
jgi:TrmH family RNA methyltransferase